MLALLPIFLSAKSVKIDEVLTEEKKLQADIGLTYINIQKNSGQAGLVEYQTASGDFLTIPTYLGVSESQTDRLNYGLNLRYGATKNLELFTFANFYSSIERTIGFGTSDSKAKNGFNSFGLGASYQVKAEDKTPSLLVGGTLDILERDELLKYDAALKSGTFFMASFYTVDPIVFFVKGTYGYNASHANNGRTLDIGNTITVNPQIYFAVNPYTSINWGLRYQYKQKDSLSGVALSSDQSQLGFLFGASYEMSPKSIFSIDVEHTNAPSHSQGSVGFNFTYKF